MTIKTGSYVSHTGAMEWGVGKVLETTADMVRIQFSDGRNRKIVASHFTSLQPAAAASYIQPEIASPTKTVRATATSRKKK